MLDNLIKVGKVKDAISGSSLLQQAETIEKDQISRPNSPEIKEILSAANIELAKRESAINVIGTVKTCLENLKIYEKVLDDLQLAHLRNNREGVIDILRRIDLTEIVDNRHVPLIGAIHSKFTNLFTSIQDSLFRHCNIRNDFSNIDKDITTMTLIANKNLLPVAIGKYWNVCVGQAQSIVIKGEISSSGLAFSKEDDLIHLLKRDPYEKFVNSHALISAEDVSKNCVRYITMLGEAFAGLAMCSRVFGNLEVSKREFATAAKELVRSLIDKLDSMINFLDYRLVNHEKLSMALGRLLSVLKRVYFDSNPEEDNRKLKENLFRLLAEYYRHLLRILTTQSNQIL